MTLYRRKLKSGWKWRYQGYYKGYGRKTGPSFDTKEEARQAEREFMASIKGDSLQSLLTAYVKHIEGNTTNKGYQKQSERVIQAFMDFLDDPAYPVKSVSRRQIEEYKLKEVVRLQEEGLSPHTVNYALRILKAFFNFAIRIKEIEMSNPVVNVKHLALNDESKYIPSDQDLSVLREDLDNDQALLVAFVAETGCRINEALRLTGKDIRPDTITLWTRKSKNSNLTSRVIPRPYCLTDDLTLGDDERVFPRWKAQPRFLEKTVRDLMKEKDELTGQPKIPQYFNWHNLRHKGASEWASQGMVMIEIMARLGHSNIETTQKYLQSLGFSSVQYTQGDRPDYLSGLTGEQTEEFEQLSQEEDAKLVELLARKIGPKLAQKIVYGVPDKDTEKDLKKLGITSDVIREYIKKA